MLTGRTTKKQVAVAKGESPSVVLVARRGARCGRLAAVADVLRAQRAGSEVCLSFTPRLLPATPSQQRPSLSCRHFAEPPLRRACRAPRQARPRCASSFSSSHSLAFNKSSPYRSTRRVADHLLSTVRRSGARRRAFAVLAATPFPLVRSQPCDDLLLVSSRLTPRCAQDLSSALNGLNLGSSPTSDAEAALESSLKASSATSAEVAKNVHLVAKLHASRAVAIRRAEAELAAKNDTFAAEKAQDAAKAAVNAASVATLKAELAAVRGRETRAGWHIYFLRINPSLTRRASRRAPRTPSCALSPARARRARRRAHRPRRRRRPHRRRRRRRQRCPPQSPRPRPAAASRPRTPCPSRGPGGPQPAADKNLEQWEREATTQQQHGAAFMQPNMQSHLHRSRTITVARASAELGTRKHKYF